MAFNKLGLLFVLLGLLFVGAVRADEYFDSQFPPAEGTEQPEMLKQVEDRLLQIQSGLQKQKRTIPAALDLKDDGIALLLDSPYLAQFNNGQQHDRYLLGRLVVLNRSSHPVTVEMKHIRLLVDGRQFPVDLKQDSKRYASPQLKGRHYSLSEMQPDESITVPSGQVGSSWVVFTGLDAGDDIPSLDLQGMIDGKKFELDLRLQHAAILHWQREQIGPEGIVALGTIGGEINTINLGTIIDDMVDLTTRKVSRVVIQFAAEAPEVDPHLMQWFLDNARRAGIETAHQPFLELPSFPSLINELHLVDKDRKSGTVTHEAHGQIRVHTSLLDAVMAAAGSAYESMTSEILMEEIKSGHPLSRCTALTFGAAQLPVHFLPTIIALTEGNAGQEQPYQLQLRQSATAALSEFNDPLAIATLEKLVRSDDKQVVEAALNSLGTSRFPAHQEALMNLLETSPPLQPEIVRALARFPKRRWAETLYQYAIHEPVSLQIEAIRALNVIGHPQLPALLVQLLDSEQTELRNVALELLSGRDDPQSREKVIQFALQTLEKSPDPQALQVISRHKVQEAIPQLLAAIQKEGPQRFAIIQTLGVIGDDRILDDLIVIYPQLKPHEQAAVLRMLAQIDQNRFLEFSGQALQSNDAQVYSTTCQLLQEFATLESVDILIQALEQVGENTSKSSTLTQALGNLSTPESRRYLVKLRDTGSREKQQQARNALETLYYRSPVNNIYQQALQTSNTDNKLLAIQQFTVAIDGDAAFPHAYQGRAEAYRSLNRLDEALADYNTLLSLDPKWPGGEGRLGQVLTGLSRFEAAIPHLTKAIEYEGDNAHWYSSRAHAYSMLERFEPAEADYRKALALDPDHETALTGVALSLAISGKVEEAIELLDKSRSEHDDHAIFAYNAACIYSRAAESLQKKQDQSEEQKQKIIKLVSSALDELDRSVELGYNDAEWTRNDPDLKMLREQERFSEALLKMQKKPVPVKRPDEDAPLPRKAE